MNTLGLVFFLIFMVAALGLFVKIVIDTRKLVKDILEDEDYKKYFRNTSIFVISASICFTISLFFIYLWFNISPLWWEILATLIFPLLFSLSLFTFYVTFRIHYYRKEIPENINKWLYRIMLICIPVMVITIWYSFNGFARYIDYPLINALSLTKGFINTTETASSGLTITFYAISILAGAVFVYFLCDHKLYQQFGKHGIIESTFLVAFPSGIIGARIWYVIGNWTVDGFDKDPIRMFYIWEGGLTIFGGAALGIIVGVLWFMWRNKHYSIWVAIDIIVPTILLAQAIGRTGNFFNCEVHGEPVSIAAWQWLPMIITNNGVYSSTQPTLTDGTFYLPLFLIEAVINIAGYFILSELFGKKLRKYTELGDLAFGYIVIYGLVRAVLEPLRNNAYNMGENGYWSWIMSALFITIGVVCILANHLIRYFIRKKKQLQKANNSWKTPSFITMLSIIGVGLVLVIVGSILMGLNTVDFTQLIFDGFNIGVVLLIIGISTIVMAGVPLIYFVESKSCLTASIREQ